ncbi:MAG: membrane protein insertase YidC [Spirosomataceae bacterium]
MEQKPFDKNFLIGMTLLMVMWGAYTYFSPNPTPETTQKAQPTAPNTPNKVINAAPAPLDSNAAKAKFGSFASAATGVAKSIVIENEDAKYTFSTLGGSIQKVELKKYSAYDDFKKGNKTPLTLIDDNNSTMAFEVVTNTGKVDLKKLYYTTDNQPVVLKGNQETKVVFKLNLAANQYVEQTYTIKGKGYNLEYDVNLVGLDAIVQNQNARFYWQDRLKKLENDLTENRRAAQINYWQTEDEFDDLGSNSMNSDEREIIEPMSWFSFKQKYFVSGFITKNQAISTAKLKAITPENDSSVVKSLEADVTLPISDLKTGKGNYRFYFGPNEYSQVKDVANGFHRNVYLGYDFVKPINRYIFVPLFNFFEGIISNYGLLIIAIVVLLKLILTPLIYKSYISSAKMRILAPEIAAIKEKVGDDQMKLQQEQMKLYQQVGVSPLSGCVPLLLQMPILMSVFFLFPNMIMFRQKPFLWADDLSTYDYPISWATNLPIIGNHISLFVVLMTISSLAFTYYNNQVTPDQPGPIDMKKISYIFPLVFFFVLNSFPAALSFYYLVSNVITIIQQQVVRRFVDEDKIKAILEENRRKFKSDPNSQKKSGGKFADFMQKQIALAEENRKKNEELKERVEAKKKNNKKQ